MSRRNRITFVATVACLFLAAVATAQKIKIESNRDEKANFAGLRTYKWLPSPPLKSDTAPGALTNPTLTKEVMEPHIIAAVDRELAARGMKRIEEGEPDASVVCYAALSVGVSSEQLGSYYQYTTGWALPAVPPVATQYNILERASIVIDLVERGANKAIWRASAASDINRESTLEKRIARVNEVVVRMFERFPVPKTGKR